MINRTALRAQAKVLRTNFDFEKALPLYRMLWAETKDEIDAAGVLHCLRKLKAFDEAINFSKQLKSGPYKMDWLKNELAWTYIEGLLLKDAEDKNIQEIIDIADTILQYDPDLLARKKSILSVLKIAKQHNRWDIISKWLEKIDPTDLSTESSTLKGRTLWSDQAVWYNYYLRSLIELNECEKTIEVVKSIESRFPRQLKYFLRLKGLAYFRLGDFEEAEMIYKQLCFSQRIDWWVLHEYASTIFAIGRKNNDLVKKQQALHTMYKASILALEMNKPQSLLTLLFHITEVQSDLQMDEARLLHLLLIKHIREEHNWPISSRLSADIDTLSESSKRVSSSMSSKELLQKCQDIWNTSIHSVKEKDSPTKRVRGRIKMGPPNRKYCFIITSNADCFCPKRMLPFGINDGDEVVADIIASFDSKKKRDGWKAIKVEKN